MDGLKLAAVLLVLYTVTLAAFGVASVLDPRVRAWYVPHVRAFALLGLVGVVALFVEIGVEATR
jgi:hypothetical protein